MRAIEYSENGPADVLKLVDKDTGTPGPDEVLVRIAVSGVNPTDWKARQGTGTTSGAPLAHPQVPNQDGSGVVESVGSSVDTLSPGDRVWVWDAAYQRSEGTAQELVVIPAAQVVRLGDRVSFDVGASLGIPALTAHQALTARENGPAELSPGALEGVTVLVAGGAGAVGHAAIQLATWAGATVITTVSGDEKGTLARAAGAHHVIDYKLEDATARVRQLAPEGVDVIVEVNIVANIGLDMEVVATGGTIAAYAGNGSDAPSIPLRAAMAKNVRVQFLLTYTASHDQKQAAVRAVAAAADAGALDVGEEHGLPVTRFPLERTDLAHQAVEDGVVGKVLIDVAAL
jgi:NADPH2:quinone reductase